MGTPNFAVPILEKIITFHDVVLVVSQPDQYSKKHKKFLETPVKQKAKEFNIEVFQPLDIKTEYEKILLTDVDLIVTAAYGQFIPKLILEHPKHKAINVHGSLLPKYRGGAPIQRAIMEGEDKTGITIIYMGVKMDAGDMILKREIKIKDTDTGDSLFENLSHLGSEMILPVINDIENGTVKKEMQDSSQVTFAYNLTKEDELVDFSSDARSIFNKIRGLNSNPGAYFMFDGISIKVYESIELAEVTEGVPGEIIRVNKDSFDVACKNNTVIRILEVQMASKNRMNARDFLNGSGRKLIIKGKVIK